ncbi:SusC/RagA family TonB-linked outer membrane protein [Alkalitalea saponilacus]|uniref:TonB-linked outer membrane protein, SusC/RagA family n=1 Tax=Alkalitalea saponilacus TaxID=889453 RepID=A0A1T5ADD4_9BACT|nr:TonB-dependent receptor [Alkalitalea saponilacus]ASB51074.1 SusC/RagA family TonB-linked outer membrane protein [Alkalitalea saponilacus]SKB32936.1 TonB-linked outer membrane protein, SusC/RagA family [Alkalitalea saponilacus]
MTNLFNINRKRAGGNPFRLLLFALILLFSQIVYSQGHTVTGTITDSNGDYIPGVNIREQGTNVGTITDINGQYTINVSPDSELLISFIGFRNATVEVNGRSVIDIVIQEDTYQLDDIIVVGYGQQRRESVVGAISSVGTEEILRSSSPNITQAIAGKLPGVITSQSSGAPGMDDAEIFIRGRASFAGDNQPLVLVDGVEREFSQIAPDDIESISVLKDASATAVYGVRGANGVILVTTKRGREQAPTVSLTANYQMQMPTRGDAFLDSYQSVKLLEEARANDGLSSIYSAQDIEMFRRSVRGELSPREQQLYPNVDWYDEILRRSAPAERYNVNIQGGTRRIRYFTSLEYFNQGGLYRDNNNYDYGQSGNVNFRRYSFRVNLDFLVTSNLTASVNFGTRFQERKGPNIIDDQTSGIVNEVFYELSHTPGWQFPIQYENGFYGGNSQHQNNIAAKLANGGFYETTRTINETNFILDYKMDYITPGLSARGMVSFDYDTDYDRRFSAPFATYELIDRDNPELETSYTRFGEDGELVYQGNVQRTSMKTYMEYALNYSRMFDDLHEVTGLVLYNQNDYSFQAQLPRRYQGLVGRVTYNFDRRYFWEMNAGYNGSENFAKGNRFGFFPSFSAGWMLSNESFMDQTNLWLDALKLKASYGEVGNDAFRRNGQDIRFLYVDSWTQLNSAYMFGNNFQPGIFEGRYPNYAVTWERARKYNAGVESSFRNGLFALNFDVFLENRDNILTDYLTKPAWLAVEMAPGNLGETQNKGFEIELRHNNRLGALHYFVNANFMHARNEIKFMDEPVGMPDYRKREGRPINQFFGLIADGFVTQADIDAGNLPVSTFGDVQPGDLKYRDMNGDGFIDERDVTFIGYSDIPENTFSFSFGGNYKGWGFSAMFQGVSNVSRFYDAGTMFAFVNNGKVSEHHLHRWNPAVSEAENLANAKYPLLHYDEFGNHNQRLNSFFLQDGSFIRLKNVEVSYTVPKMVSQRWHMSELRFYVNANNLITWDNLDIKVDPESRGSFHYPIMKAVNLGVNVKF